MQPLALHRPFRATAIAFAVMSGFWGVCAAFHPTDVVPVVTWGLGYSLLLSVFATGVMLASGKRLSYWLWWSCLVVGLATLGLWLLLRLGPSMEVFFGVCYGVFALLVITGALGLVVSGWGWILYFRRSGTT
jgi:hypothetical protein